MKRLLIAAVLTTISCAAPTPTQPTAIAPSSPTKPATLSLGIIPASGGATILAIVQNGAGERIPNLAVAFSTDHGSLDAATAQTNGNGEARAVLTSSTSATVTATAGTITQSTIVSIQPAPPSYPPAPPPVITPVPTPTPPTPTPTPTPVLAITVECTPGTLSVGCHVSMTGADGSSLTSTITTIDWNWGDGSLSSTANPPAATTHGYLVSGTYLIIATAHAPAGSATNTVTVKIP